LAGPTATQLLADLGAEVIKVERPLTGDDTRSWGPPFLETENGYGTGESAYFLSANRGKHSLAVDMASPEGQIILTSLVMQSDIIVENFKPGDLERYNLDYASLSKANPRLIYCSISGFGRTGPNAKRAGYDFLVQGEGGLMSLTGEADGPPLKAGVGVADVICGMYAASGILAAIQARHHTGRGQHIDLALLDSQIALLINQGVGFLTDGKVPPRRGNDHPTIVPYGIFPAADKDFILAIGNDQQFKRFVDVAGHPDLATDVRFKNNPERVRNRGELLPILRELTMRRTCADWLLILEDIGVPAGPVNDLSEVFLSPQVAAREMKITLPYATAKSGEVSLIGNPLKLSDTPVSYRKAPPKLGQDTGWILKELLGYSDVHIQELKTIGVIDGEVHIK
jgi:crotonobetainyl-CoA:carnitine CoA-transferase CaiB-like acyl-CoA transferase